ncbi:MAG: DUF2520 domain-containing protein [Bacteroidota bacterium]
MTHIPVTVIGAGNLAWSLIPALQAAGISSLQLISRNAEQLQAFQDAYGPLQIESNLDRVSQDSVLVFLTVSDQAVQEVATALKDQVAQHSLVVHCSGSTPLSALNLLRVRTGVFYPLQTFTKDKVVSFQQVPLFLEGSPGVLASLRPLAESLSEKVFSLASEDRLRMHLGAVIANNFSNLLYQIAAAQLPSVEGMDFRVYEALIREHIDKVFEFLPHQTQTGPARRGDEGTMQQHLDLLQPHPEIQALYRSLSEMIQQRHP